MTYGIALTTLLVRDYDEAIEFYTKGLGFEVSADQTTNTGAGEPKRWVEVRPPGGSSGLLLAKADGAEQEALVGQQFGGRVGLFLHVKDFDAAYASMKDKVKFLEEPRSEPYGKVVVFQDLYGNQWDLMEPRS
ncbi:MAG: hypothetical protein GOMPHAMPRED_002086 [Gomphillus americanus]|uniref:VOC domain-containing protein n=1 Tax=Gomphillus americanus TaxID=1940652 RepID=A0A8H3F754_9LECA|nr:MAG: hypothetical protein GOMPHAMPRED_002086 [Gomphillus americanus]